MAALAKAAFCDIGVNLLDPVFTGLYHGAQKHASDFAAMLERAKAAGVREVIVTAGTVEEVGSAVSLCEEFSQEGLRLFSTVGVHPTRCNEFLDDPEGVMASLLKAGSAGKERGQIVAIGEFGLDWDRTQFCPPDVQTRFFEAQFQLVDALDLPLFLHSRGTEGVFEEVLKRHWSRARKGGVVHSFTGSVREADTLLAMGLYIGINGCSMKTPESVEVVKHIPLSRLLLETDAPWCDIRPTHASFPLVKTHWKSQKKEKFVMGDTVKGRTEPCHIVQVAEVVAGIKGVTVEEVAATAYANSRRLFWES